ncbi:MAG: cation:proton antiporter subunit C [Bacteroidales bacterium]|nr:cation:proton antiporter subunit C [Bacteroidales bacterium]MCF8458215.1 cation:proton antiporter subunit C [Bacteroidales bacterium]
MEYISIIVGLLLIIFGLWGVLTQKNILKIIIGFSLFDTGLHVVMVSISYVKGRTAPILDDTVSIADAAKKIVDPIPQALVLTAIVIGLGVTALMLAYAMKMYKQKGTLDISGYKELNG